MLDISPATKIDTVLSKLGPRWRMVISMPQSTCFRPIATGEIW